jgi:hypothetical protein
MVPIGMGMPSQGQVSQGPPNWSIQFSNVAAGTYNLQVGDPVTGAHDVQQNIVCQ